MMEQKQPYEHTAVPSRVFVAVWIVLLLLTGATIGAADLELGAWSMVANILVASTKAGLVLWYFMHLKYESKLFKWMLLAPIMILTFIIGFTFFDIWYR